MVGLECWFFIKGINFPYHMGDFYMLGYEFYSHKLVPLCE